MIVRLIAAAALATVVGGAGPALARWADWPPVADSELEQVVRVAYGAAAAHARGNVNYFARDGLTAPLRSAVEDALGREGLSAVEVAPEPAANLATARLCGSRRIELRFATNLYGDGISLAAVTSRRVFSYHYDPHEDAAIVVAPATDCAPR